MGPQRCREARLVLALGLSAALWSGCYESHTREPEISMATFTAALAEGPRRLELAILPGTPPVARQVEVAEAAALADDEVIGARVVEPGTADVVADPVCTGRITTTLTTELRFDDRTTVFAEDGDGIECEGFVIRVEQILEAGREPFVTAYRSAPEAPQAPDDPDYSPVLMDLDGDAPPLERVEMNADADNLLECDQLDEPPAACMGVLQLLGRAIVLEEGVTRIQRDPRASVGP